MKPRTRRRTSDAHSKHFTASSRVRWGAAALLVAIVLVVTYALLNAAPAFVRTPTALPTLSMKPSEERAREVLGTPRSGGEWFSGVWAGGDIATGSRVNSFGQWRGTPVDAATTYPADRTWQEFHDSNWHISTFAGFKGIIAYGLPMLPSDDKGNFQTIVAGDHDWVYRKVAQDLVDNHRGRSVVRVGWEANGNWFAWNTKAANADQYVAAFRHIVGVLRATAPNLIIDFDIACGVKLRGQDDRLDALSLLYPGDDVVDLIGCDTYDWYHTTTTDEKSWALTKSPKDDVGIQDVADFARARGKGMTVPEWGLAHPDEGGVGDNPYFIRKMRAFFKANADILVLESYFSEPDTSLRNSLWDPDQNPRSAQEYARLW